MQSVNETIFRAYDIRGLYPQEIDGDLAFRVGQALAELLKSENPDKEKLVFGVSRDVRLSSPELYSQVIAGINKQGVDVFEFGIAPTPTFYFGVAKYQLDGGIQVSASHNPKDFNGFKMVRKQSIPVSGDTGILVIRDLVKANQFKQVEQEGQVRQVIENLIDEHVAYDLEFCQVKNIRPMKIVVDAACSVSALYFEKLFANLPIELVKLNFELDGTFPAHEADPLKDENNRQIQAKVLEVNADLGISMDGDGDRIFFITNEGKTIEPAISRGVLAQIFLRDNPGANICYDIRPGKITIDLIEEAGGKPIVTRVGHSLIKEKAREVNAPFAGESSGHFFVKMSFGFFEAPGIVALKLIEEFSSVNSTVAEFVAPLYRYSHSGEINFEVTDKKKVFDLLRAKYGVNLKYEFDGVYFEWQDWWFSVRASNTENLVRLNLEATNESLMTEKTNEVKLLITS